MKVTYLDEVGYEFDSPTKCQLEILKTLDEDIASFESAINIAVINYYKEYISILGLEEDEMDDLPALNDEKRIVSEIKLEQVIIPNKNCKRYNLGLIYDAEWEPEHQVGILIKEGKITQVREGTIAYDIDN